MCEPVTIASLAISAVSAVASHVGQQNAAKAQEAAALQAHNASMSQLEVQRNQQNAESQQQMSERGKQALAERGRLRAAAAEGGVGGNSIDRIFGANEFALGQDMAMMQENSRNVARQSSAEAAGIAAQTQGRLNQIQRPSALATGLQIAGIGVDGYSKYKKVK